jgi:hypothetical protein
MTMRRRVRNTALLCAALGARTLAAQDSTTVAADTVVPIAPQAPAVEERRGASPTLPQEHWAVRAAARAEALGLAPGYFPAQRSAPLAAVAAALREAAMRAPLERPAMGAVAAGWVRRLEEEFSGVRAGERSPLLGASAGVAGAELRGRLRPASGLFAARTDPVPLADVSEWGGTGMAAAALGPLALVAAATATDDGVYVPLWEVSGDAGPLSLGFGRQPVGYGPGRGGGVILSGQVPLVRGQIQTARPVHLPWVLRHLGPTTFHTSLTRLREPRQRGNPWFWTARMGVQPHPRVEVAVSRASIFGGDSISTPTNLENVAKMALGLLSLDFENQEVSADFRVRLPTERWLPATAYLEWGAEDAAGALRDVPGRVVGVLLPALPGVPGVSAGAEYAHFPVHCCGNPPWYFHAAHPGGWVYRDLPLGHPLGGEGHEASVYADAELWDARVRLSGRAFFRERSQEGFLTTPQRAGNLYSPTRAGGSRGGALDAALRLAPHAEGTVSLYRDAGDGWREQRLRVGLSYLF